MESLPLPFNEVHPGLPPLARPLLAYFPEGHRWHICQFLVEAVRTGHRTAQGAVEACICRLQWLCKINDLEQWSSLLNTLQAHRVEAEEIASWLVAKELAQ